MSKDILVIGKGGREHALGWKLHQSPNVEKLYFAPGNAGTENLGTNVSISEKELDRLAAFVADHKVDLTVVGPENPLAEGLANLFTEESLKVFGPTKEAARIESDKIWAHELEESYKIPHPKGRGFRPGQIKDVISFVKAQNPLGIVIKANGLFGGKGVELPKTREEARQIVIDMMENGKCGDAGRSILIQERLKGPEVSVMAISDGKTVIPLPPVQDHKRLLENDQGPNTGGMGAYAPVPKKIIPTLMIKRVHREILQPAIDALREEGVPFKGVLYAGLMLTKDGPKVLEFNCRFGDPETQPLMMLLNSDLLPILKASVDGTLSKEKIVFSQKAAFCIVLASGGYPDKYKIGYPIRGLKDYGPNVVIFHAGTKRNENGKFVTNGGRVLNLTVRADSLKEAIPIGYSILENSEGPNFENSDYRKDLGIEVL